MKILLIQDVANLGRIGELAEVKDGYARNYLIPQHLAIPATPGAIKQAEQLRQAAEKRRNRDLETAQDFAGAIAELSLTFKRKVGEKGRLYGSVTSADITEQIESALKAELDKRKVELQEPLKNLGDYEVEINLHPDVVATVKVQVIGEDGETAADFAEEEDVDATAAVSAEQPDADY